MGTRKGCHAPYQPVFGDIHGRADLLDQLLAQLDDTHIVVLGDVCDYGPDTRGVLDRLVERGAHGVRGNHEEWFTRWATGGGFDSFALSSTMGGRATLDSYGVVGRTPREIEDERWRVGREHRAWLAALPVALDLEVCGERYWVTHAGVPADVPEQRAPADVVPWLAEHQPGELVWPVTRPEAVARLDRPVVMGHVVVREPLDLGHVVAVDTGCGVVPEGRLTAVVLPERRFVSVG